MGSTENIIGFDTRFQGLLERFLLDRSAGDQAFDTANHLDEETLAAFVEGNMTMREATPLVTHLSDCGFCRTKTVELVRLELAINGPDIISAATVENVPAKASESISGILSRLFGHGDSAVMAHEEKPSDEDEADSDDKESN